MNELSSSRIFSYSPLSVFFLSVHVLVLLLLTLAIFLLLPSPTFLPVAKKIAVVHQPWSIASSNETLHKVQNL